MDLGQATAELEESLANPYLVWQSYDPSDIPFAIYNETDVEFLQHPNPPETRPTNLLVATAIDINNLQTATVPIMMFNNITDFIAVAYHEGFHVYQHHHFVDDAPYDFFMALAHYPELNATYRALCKLETDCLNSDVSAQDKINTLATITKQRQILLSELHPDLRAFEHAMERSEGTASYVEQVVRQKLAGIAPPPIKSTYGWSRFYETASAICWLLADLDPDFQQKVQDGQSPSDVISSKASATVDIPDLEVTIAQEQAHLDTVLPELNTTIQSLKANSISIRYPVGSNVYRAYSPNTMRLLGDGSLLHPENSTVILPPHGQVDVQNGVVLEDIRNGVITLPKIPVTLSGSLLTGEADGIKISFKNVSQVDVNTYRLDV